MENDKSGNDNSYLPRAWGSLPSENKSKLNSQDDPQEHGSAPKTPDAQTSGGRPLTPTGERDFFPDRTADPEAPGSQTTTANGTPKQNDQPLEPARAIRDHESAQHVSPSESDREAPTFFVRIAGIRFGYACKIYHFEAGDMELATDDWVIVKTEKGVGLGRIALAPFEKEIDGAQREGLRKIIRKAGKVDFDQKGRCCQRESEAFAYCLERIEALGLPMKLVSVECFFDGSKYVFYFTAEGRIDFRELVKQLVARFPVRIEMRQIGVRHEAKMTGGLACCGQELCCSRFLTDFRPVSVKMAKNQNLSLNPTKISGVCGRLMCCLAYEHDSYEKFKKGLPRVGKTIHTTRGDGVVLKHNPLTETVCVRFGEDSISEVTKDEIVLENEPPEQKKGSKDKASGKRGKGRQNKGNNKKNQTSSEKA